MILPNFKGVTTLQMKTDNIEKTYIHKLLDFELITQTSLAAKMWPQLNKKVAYNKLYNKLNGIADQRITEEDIMNAKTVCKDLKVFL